LINLVDVDIGAVSVKMSINQARHYKTALQIDNLLLSFPEGLKANIPDDAVFYEEMSSILNDIRHPVKNATVR
jgi:hypothetical protein